MTRLHMPQQVPRQVAQTLAIEVLADAGFLAVPYGARHAALGARLGIDFGAILFTLDHLPLALNGSSHAEQRADVARFLAEQRGAVDAALPKLVAQAAGVIGTIGRHDMMAKVIEPLVEGLIAVMVDLRLNLPMDSLVSRIFSQKIGVAQRKRLDVELAGLLARMAVAHPGDSDLRRGTRMALVVLGRDALIGTLGQSLHAHFTAGIRIAGRELAIPPSHTGVPYIDRVAGCPAHLGAETVAKGDILRCQLSSFDGASAAERLRFFGAGAHTCLGRGIAMDLFRLLAAALAKPNIGVNVLNYTLRDDDVFHYPAQFEIEVTA